jgi:hypothetical protein
MTDYHFRKLPRWVAWLLEERNGKPTKVPYSPHGGRAKADDPSTWGTRAEAETRAAALLNGSGVGGIGINLGDLGADEYLAGIDLDSCLDPNAGLAPWAEPVLAALGTYAEISPSGRGIKALFCVAREDVRPFLALLGVSDPDQWGIKRSVGNNGGDHGPGIEIYCARRYFTITGELWPGKPRGIHLLEWTALERLAALVPKPQNSRPGAPGRDTSRSAKALREGARLRRERKTFEEMCEALRNHPDPEIRAWYREKGEDLGQRQLRRIWEKAGPAEGREGVTLDDFRAHMPSHSYVFVPARALWPSASVNARIPPIPDGLDHNGKPKFISASTWLDKHRPVEQMTWAPGLPMIIDDRLLLEGGWIERNGVSCFNLYIPASPISGDARQARPWLEHVEYVFPDDADHIINWSAHRVQHPEEKINHALVLGGGAGIGKDSLLAPLRHAVGSWNFREASPTQVLGRFNSFLKGVVLRVSEARDLGEFDRFAFYDRMKGYITSPPETLRVDEKHIREYDIINCVGVVITTNHKTDGIYLAPDDRRHYVCWSDLIKEDPHFQGGYWDKLWNWYYDGGFGHVAAFLQQRDLSGFNPKAPPPQTEAFWAIVNASRAPEESELADVLDLLGNPDAVTLGRLKSKAEGETFNWLNERKNRRTIPHRLENCGYVPVRNPDSPSDGGQWKIGSQRQSVYAKKSLPLQQQIEAARKLARAG